MRGEVTDRLVAAVVEVDTAIDELIDLDRRAIREAPPKAVGIPMIPSGLPLPSSD